MAAAGAAVPGQRRRRTGNIPCSMGALPMLSGGSTAINGGRMTGQGHFTLRNRQARADPVESERRRSLAMARPVERGRPARFVMWRGLRRRTSGSRLRAEPCFCPNPHK